MALIQVNFMSQSLMRTVQVQVIFPVDKLTLSGMPKREEKPYKTLYLLHGVFGNCTDWITGTAIQRWAEEKNLAVVMPSGDNMFYVDQEAGHNYYGEFIGKELVEITRKMFPLSHGREDTFIGGLSMGGYGALRNGLKYADTFGYIVALSSALITDDIDKRTDDAPFFIENRTFAESVFGNLANVEESDKNPKWLVRKLKEEGVAFPQIYMACGKQDFLLGANQDFCNYLQQNGAAVIFEEDEGAHEWDFWGRAIQKALNWLPLEQDETGINSGNIGE